LVAKQKRKNLQTSLGFRVLQVGGAGFVAKQKGKTLQTSLGFRVFQHGEVLAAKQEGKT
jgi:hypothetical protein